MKAQFFPLKDLNPSKGIQAVTLGLIAINSIAFIIELIYGLDTVVQRFGFVPADPTFITIITSMFLHGGLAHLFGNMWYLYIFGDNVELELGALQYIFLYAVSGLAATFTHYLTSMGSSVPTVGASGAVSGILGAYMVMFPGIKILARTGAGTSKVPAFTLIGLWFVFQFIMATTSLLGGQSSNVAFWAHVGGFVVGAAYAFVAIKT